MSIQTSTVDLGHSPRQLGTRGVHGHVESTIGARFMISGKFVFEIADFFEKIAGVLVWGGASAVAARIYRNLQIEISTCSIRFDDQI